MEHRSVRGGRWTSRRCTRHGGSLAGRHPRRSAPCASAGIHRIVLLSGDRHDVAKRLAVSRRPICPVRAQPGQKVQAVLHETRARRDGHGGRRHQRRSRSGGRRCRDRDGRRGSTASSEAADAVIVVDRLDRVAEAILIARRARDIAVQSVHRRHGLCRLSACVLAAVGLLPPVAGAFFQEAIDVAVILNALRALGGGDLPTSARVTERRSEASARRLPDGSARRRPQPQPDGRSVD